MSLVTSTLRSCCYGGRVDYYERGSWGRRNKGIVIQSLVVSPLQGCENLVAQILGLRALRSTPGYNSSGFQPCGSEGVSRDPLDVLCVQACALRVNGRKYMHIPPGCSRRTRAFPA